MEPFLSLSFEGRREEGKKGKKEKKRKDQAKRKKESIETIQWALVNPYHVN
jgi:hypothetical protein